MRTRLVELVPAAVRALALDEPIYALVLAYDDAEPLPPTIGVGLERERVAWTREPGTRAAELVWNPAE